MPLNRNSIILKPFVVLMLLFGFSCQKDATDVKVDLSKTKQLFGCSKSMGLSSDSAAPVPQSCTTYCKASRLYWNFDSTSTILKLMHARAYFGCEAQPEMNIYKENSAYTISEDANANGPEALCSCPFSMYCEISIPEKDSITINFTTNFTINLHEKSGSIVLDTNDASINQDCLNQARCDTLQ